VVALACCHGLISSGRSQHACSTPGWLPWYGRWGDTGARVAGGHRSGQNELADSRLIAEKHEAGMEGHSIKDTNNISADLVRCIGVLSSGVTVRVSAWRDHPCAILCWRFMKMKSLSSSDCTMHLTATRSPGCTCLTCWPPGGPRTARRWLACWASTATRVVAGRPCMPLEVSRPDWRHRARPANASPSRRTCAPV
jgi:hypothetical protein